MLPFFTQDQSALQAQVRLWAQNHLFAGHDGEEDLEQLETILTLTRDLGVNLAGVIPIIFAVSVLQFPGTIAQFVRYEPIRRIGEMVLPGRPLGDALYFVLIILFTYFYTAVSFDPVEVSDNIKKYGGFVPGIRPGRPTSDYLSRVVERLTFVGALVLALIAVAPVYLARGTGVLTFYLAGTSLLIVVGVALETMKQIEAYVLMRHYEGFMR